MEVLVATAAKAMEAAERELVAVREMEAMQMAAAVRETAEEVKEKAVMATAVAVPKAHRCGRSTACWRSRCLGADLSYRKLRSCPGPRSPLQTSTCPRLRAGTPPRAPC